MDLADLVGLHIVLNGIPGKGHSKVLTAGIGWATAEVYKLLHKYDLSYPFHLKLMTKIIESVYFCFVHRRNLPEIFFKNFWNSRTSNNFRTSANFITKYNIYQIKKCFIV